MVSVLTSLPIQWLRLHLPMQGVRVRSLVWEVRSYVLCSPRNENVKQKRNSSKFNKDFKNEVHQKKILKKYMRVCLSVGGGSDEISVCLGRTWGVRGSQMFSSVQSLSRI